MDEEDDSDDEVHHHEDGVDTSVVKIEKVKEESVKEIALPPVKKEEIKEEEDELDPLDAYMSEVSKEVRKIKGASFRAAKGIVTTTMTTAAAAAATKAVKGEEKKEANGVNGEGEKKGLVIMTGVAKKKPELNIKKPEVRCNYFKSSDAFPFIIHILESGSTVCRVDMVFVIVNQARVVICNCT